MKGNRDGRGWAALAGAALLVAGSLALADNEPPAVLDLLLPDGRRTEALTALADTLEVAPGEDFALLEIGRDAHSSHHLAAIRTREPLHRHDRHDLFVVLLRGHGQMLMGKQERPAGPGSILYVPRGTVHSFRSESAEPALAYAVYVPAFDGTDRVLTE